MKKALIVWGGWDGHEPEQVAGILAEQLQKHDFDVEVSDTLDSFKDVERLKTLDLIVPEWTMGSIEKEQLQGVLGAVESGVGIAGLHGGMGDSFRQSTEWQWMVGGQWVAHPGGDGVTYGVHVTDIDHEITRGVEDFETTSEQYLMHVDPGNHVLALTFFGHTAMPVAWTKRWGKGRVFYSSLGHVAKTLREPMPLKLMTQGMLWASEKD